MAGERKGIAYEAILYHVVSRVLTRNANHTHLFWNETPAGMTIEPDLLIGPDVNHPTMAFLVTHSGSASDSHKKLWRNMGELVETKCQLPTRPLVFNIAFDAAIRDDLVSIQAAAFDGQLIVGKQDYGPELQVWVDNNLPSLPVDRQEKAEFVGSAKGKIRRLLQRLESDIQQLISGASHRLEGVWSAERSRQRAAPPVARNTSLRRGVGKLLVIETLDRVNKQGLLAKSTPLDVANTLLAAGYAAKSISGIRVNDPEMLWALTTFSKEQLQLMLGAGKEPRVREWIRLLKRLSSLPAKVGYVHDNWELLLTPRGMYESLKWCHKVPMAMESAGDLEISQSVWLFHLLVEWIKLSGGSRTSFGRAKIVEDVDMLSADQSHRASVKAILGREVRWNAKRSVELGLTDWHSSPSKQHFAFSDDDLARVSDALCRRLSNCVAPDPSKDLPKLSEATIHVTLESKLLTYFKFDPLSALVMHELQKASISCVSDDVVSCFAEAASSSGTQLDRRSGGTRVLRACRTLIKCQSVTDAGREHKKKELCGRSVGLRYTWNPKTRSFMNRADVSRLILVVDGEWTQSSLDALVSAGWDHIFYPDELNQLAKAIV